MKDAYTMSKELEQRYGTKQRDELSAKHPELADGVEKIEKSFGPVNLGKIVTKEEQQRTLQQNKALHKYCEMLADALNDSGLDMRKTLKPGIDIPWDKDRIKEFLWKPIQEAMTGKASTTELNTVEPSEIYAVLDRHLSSKFGLHVEWPTNTP